MTVGMLIQELSKFDQTLPVYFTACRTDENGMACGESGLEFPSPVLSHLDPAIESWMPEEERLGEFVLLEPAEKA